MTNIVSENLSQSERGQPEIFADDTFINLDVLCGTVIDSVNEVYKNLVPGLPKSVYQLKLLKCLGSKGLQLETEKSVLTRCINDELEREIIIVNGVLVIECIVEDRIINHYQKRIMFDIQNNDHAMGLLINFGEEDQNNGIEKIYQKSISH